MLTTYFEQVLVKDRRSPDYVVNTVMTCGPFFDTQKFPVQLHAIMKVVRRHSSQKTGTHTSETFIRERVSGIPESLSVADCKIALV